MLEGVAGAAGAFTGANCALIGQVAFEELMKKDGQCDEKRFIRYMTLLLKGQNLALEYEQFRCNAAKRACKYVAGLQQINAGPGDEDEKLQKAIELLFGKEPSSWVIAEPGKPVSEPMATPFGDLEEAGA
jgi:hypothetical protein